MIDDATWKLVVKHLNAALEAKDRHSSNESIVAARSEILDSLQRSRVGGDIREVSPGMKVEEGTYSQLLDAYTALLGAYTSLLKSGGR